MHSCDVGRKESTTVQTGVEHRVARCGVADHGNVAGKDSIGHCTHDARHRFSDQVDTAVTLVKDQRS